MTNDLISFKEENDWCIDLNTNGTVVKFKIDTGAQANVLPWKVYSKLLKLPKLNKSKVKLTAYNDTDIPVRGSCIAHIGYNHSSIPVVFIVADIESSPVIGLNTSSKLNLIKRVMKIKQDKVDLPDYLLSCGDCFGEVGCLNHIHHIEIDPSIQPVVNPPRRLPISLQDKIYKEIQRMIKMKIIVPISEPSDWVNNFVAVEKPNGSIRLCLDPRDLNKAIKRPHYVLPTTEEILARMTGAKLFTKLDASCAYWQIPLDYASSKLLTFNTPFGRYRFQRMAYGVKSASDVCQNYISQMLEGLEGVTNSQDDIIIWGQNSDELKDRTLNVFKSLRQHGLKLNKRKCQFHQSELIFLGHKITSNGISPDENKIKAIVDMPYPQNVKDLQRFLGTVNYLAKFIPNLSDKTGSLVNC